MLKVRENVSRADRLGRLAWKVANDVTNLASLMNGLDGEGFWDDTRGPSGERSIPYCRNASPSCQMEPLKLMREEGATELSGTRSARIWFYGGKLCQAYRPLFIIKYVGF